MIKYLLINYYQYFYFQKNNNMSNTPEQVKVLDVEKVVDAWKDRDGIIIYAVKVKNSDQIYAMDSSYVTEHYPLTLITFLESFIIWLDEI